MSSFILPSQISLVLLIAIFAGFSNAQVEKPSTEETPNESTETKPDDPELRNKVEKLARLLDSDSLLDRTNAEKELIAFGPDILGLLLPAQGEVGQRISRIRNVLERKFIEQNSQSKRVTLKGDFTVREAMKKIEAQTGNTILGADNLYDEIELAIENEPFWKAFDQVLDEAHLTIDDFGGEGVAIQVVSRSPLAAKRADQAIYSGICRIALSQVSLLKNFETPELDMCRLTIKVAWEPRLKPISMNIPLEKVTIKDDVGEKIELVREGSIGTTVQNLPAAELTLPIKLPAREAEYVTIQGELEVVVPGRPEKFEFSNLKSEKPQKMQRGEAKVILEGMRKNRDVYAARLRLQLENSGDSLESHRGWFYGNEAYLVGADGKKIESLGYEMYHQSENQIGMSYLFDVQELPDSLKLVYMTPAAIVSVPMKFELKKVKLP